MFEYVLLARARDVWKDIAPTAHNRSRMWALPLSDSECLNEQLNISRPAFSSIK